MPKSKQSIFFITPTPPPFGGIAILSKSILEAGLKDNLKVIQLNVGTKGTREKIDSIRFMGIINAILNYFKLFFLCLKNRKTNNAFVTGTSNWGVIRDFGFVFILWLFRVKILLNLHGTRKLKNSNSLIKLLSILEMRMSYKVLSPTKIDFNAAREYLKNKEKVHLFYNSTIVQIKYLETKKEHSSKDYQKLNLIGIGRLSDAKGTYDLINASIQLLKENYNIQLKWIGRGAYEEDDIRAQQILKKENIQDKIQFLQDLTEDEKYKVILESDIFILPSKNDNLPISILEAMACAKPILSTFMGAIPEVIIPNKNGWLIEPGDISELKEIIKSIYAKEYDLIKIGEFNREQFLKLYDSRKRVKEIINLISNTNSLASSLNG